MIHSEVVIFVANCNYPSGAQLMLVSDVKTYLYTSTTHKLMIIKIFTMNYHKVGNNKEVAYTNVGYRTCVSDFSWTVANSPELSEVLHW